MVFGVNFSMSHLKQELSQKSVFGTFPSFSVFCFHSCWRGIGGQMCSGLGGAGTGSRREQELKELLSGDVNTATCWTPV